MVNTNNPQIDRPPSHPAILEMKCWSCADETPGLHQVGHDTFLDKDLGEIVA
jgi:hypothetical protein